MLFRKMMAIKNIERVFVRRFRRRHRTFERRFQNYVKQELTLRAIMTIDA